MGAGFGIRGDSESDGIGRIDGDIFRSSSSRRRRALGIGIGDRQTPMERGIICVLHTHKQAHTGHKWVSNGAGGGLCDGDCGNGVREEENKGENERASESERTAVKPTEPQWKNVCRLRGFVAEHRIAN